MAVDMPETVVSGQDWVLRRQARRRPVSSGTLDAARGGPGDASSHSGLQTLVHIHRHVRPARFDLKRDALANPRGYDVNGLAASDRHFLSYGVPRGA